MKTIAALLFTIGLACGSALAAPPSVHDLFRQHFAGQQDASGETRAVQSFHFGSAGLIVADAQSTRMRGRHMALAVGLLGEASGAIIKPNGKIACGNIFGGYDVLTDCLYLFNCGAEKFSSC